MSFALPSGIFFRARAFAFLLLLRRLLSLGWATAASLTVGPFFCLHVLLLGYASTLFSSGQALSPSSFVVSLFLRCLPCCPFSLPLPTTPPNPPTAHPSPPTLGPGLCPRWFVLEFIWAGAPVVPLSFFLPCCEVPRCAYPDRARLPAGVKAMGVLGDNARMPPALVMGFVSLRESSCTVVCAQNALHVPSPEAGEMIAASASR